MEIVKRFPARSEGIDERIGQLAGFRNVLQGSKLSEPSAYSAHGHQV